MAQAPLQALLRVAPCGAEDIERWQRKGEALDEAAIAAICLRDDEPVFDSPRAGL